MRVAGRKPPSSLPENGGWRGRNGESKGLVLTEPSKAEEPVCGGGGQARPWGLKRRGAGPKVCVWVKPRNPGPRDPASSTHSTTLGKAEERPERNLGAPGPSPSLLELPWLRGARAHLPPLRSARPSPRPGSPSARCTGAAGCTSGARRSRAPLPLRAPSPGGLRIPRSRAEHPRPEDRRTRRPEDAHPGPAACAHSAASPFPRPAQARGLGIKRAARAPGPPVAPRTLTASSAGRRRGALGAAGCGGAGRRAPAWALPPPPPPPVANADLKPGERAEALRPLRARRPGPRRGCVSHPSWGEGTRTDPAPRRMARGRKLGTARARPQ